MKTPALITDYSKLKDSDTIGKVKIVIDGLTGNENFTGLEPKLAAINVLNTDFDDKVIKCATGDRTAIAVKNKARKELLFEFRQLALEVESQSNADRSILASSNFDLSADGDNAEPLASPVDFKIVQGDNPGELEFSSKRVPGVKSYLYEYTIGEVTADSKWISAVSTSKRYLFGGFTSGTRVSGRVTAIGTKGQSKTSKTINIVVQ